MPSPTDRARRLDVLRDLSAGVGITLPALLIRMFEEAEADDDFRQSLYLVGIEIDAIAIDVIDLSPVHEALLRDRFVGFAWDGCGDVYGLYRSLAPDAGRVLVCALHHEDDTIELDARSFASWLAARVQSIEDCVDEGDDEGLDAPARVRARLLGSTPEGEEAIPAGWDDRNAALNAAIRAGDLRRARAVVEEMGAAGPGASR